MAQDGKVYQPQVGAFLSALQIVTISTHQVASVSQALGSASATLSFLLTTTVGGRYSCHPHFMDKETETQ